MVKTYVKPMKGRSSGKVIPKEYPSTHGSHVSMIDKDLTAMILPKFTRGKLIREMVVCRDERGPYLTEESKTSAFNKMADNNRWASTELRLNELNAALPVGIDLTEKKETSDEGGTRR